MIVLLKNFLEGTMINCFYHDNMWKLATRSRIHADCKFHQAASKTFAEMFHDAMRICELKFTDLNKDYMYSFVLQHPENRIVIEFKKPNIALVEVKKCDGKDMTVFDIHSNEFDYLRDKVTFPKILHYYESWKNLIMSITQSNLHYTILGCIIKCKKTGKRSKIRNPEYEKIRHLKGNNPKLQFQYYNLRHLGKVSDYLYYFPEHKIIFRQLRKNLHDWTLQLWSYYLNCYIKKRERDLKSYPFQYRIHMYNLHQIYLQEFRSIGQYISKQAVIQYVNELNPATLMYAINYHLRKSVTNVS